jgi:hypothetical protein
METVDMGWDGLMRRSGSLDAADIADTSLAHA